MTSWKFYIATFGCKINQYESQLLRESWQRAGGSETTAPESADYILINSCAITARAERNARNAVFRLRQLAPNAKIILTGCAAQFYGDFKPRKNTNWASPDLCVAQKNKARLLAGPALWEETASAPQMISSNMRSRPVVKLQDGCSQNCSYCIVPQTRGKPQSRTPADVLAECRLLANSGFGEIVLSGVNLRQYQHNEYDFWRLLKWLDGLLFAEFGAKLRLRISSLDPAMLNENALETIADSNLLCRHLHIAPQHASQAILAAMRRGHYTAQNILDFCAALSKIWPVYGLGADLLTGFPGETEDDFRILLDFIEAAPLTYAHIFPYSRRQGTIAAKMENQIAKREKERRAWEARAAVKIKQKRFWAKQLELEQMLIVADSPDGSEWNKGVNEFYTPCLFKELPQRQKGLFMAAPTGVSESGLIVAAF